VNLGVADINFGVGKFSLSAFADVARTLKKMLSESAYGNHVIGLSDLLDKVQQTAKPGHPPWHWDG
jgi:hypothetical protein